MMVACLAGICMGGKLCAQDYEKHLYDSSHLYYNPVDTAYWQQAAEAGGSLEKTASRWKQEEGFEYLTQMEGFSRYVDSLIHAQRQQQKPLPSAREAFEASAVQSGSERSPWFFVVAALVLIAAALYIVFTRKAGLGIRPAVEEAAPEITVTEMEEDIWKLNYREILPKAVTEHNYRLAVRILFLQTLTLMDKKGLIRFQPDFTNYDYLLQLRTSGSYQQFALVTRHYERVWYGKFELTEEAYAKISNDFITLQSALAI